MKSKLASCECVDDGWSTRVPSRFLNKEQKCMLGYCIVNEALESHFPKLWTFSKPIEPLSRNRDLNVIQNEHVYAICCRRKVDNDVISGKNVKTFEGHAVVNFKVASFSSFQDFPKKDHLVTVKLMKAALAWTWFAASWNGGSWWRQFQWGCRYLRDLRMCIFVDCYLQ